MQLLFEYQDLSKAKNKAFKAIEKQFKKSGVEVLSIALKGDEKTTSGIKYREVLVSFKDSQTVIFRVKSSGDIYQVVINAKLTPLQNQDDHGKSIAEIAAKLDAGRAKFQQKLAKQAAKLPQGTKSSMPNKKNRLLAETQEIAKALEQAKQELNQLQQETAAPEHVETKQAQTSDTSQKNYSLPKPIPKDLYELSKHWDNLKIIHVG